MATTPTPSPRPGSSSRLRIGLLAPPWVPVPPPSYGGIEQVVATLAAGLVERGHDVVLVAAPGSVLPGAELISPLASLPGIIGEPAADWRHALAGMDALADCDVVIDHSGPLGALLTSRLAVPGLHVTHGPLDAVPTEIYEGITRHSPRLRLVAISEAQRTLAPSLPFAGVCHNGLDLDAAPFRARADGYLAFLGRMSPEKGPADAIRIAREAGLPLLIGAKCREQAEHEYFTRHVAPELGPGVVWLGELDAAGKYALLAGARALLFPIAWPEPFGMVMIEAMACGTPVLATARGSVAEVVADGVTGFVRATPDELIATVARIGEIDRRACRRRVAERFSADVMTARYEALVRAELAGPGHRSHAPRPAHAGTTWTRLVPEPAAALASSGGVTAAGA
jgi:glycosyltransferase involved in cell wall biosynthesis